MDIIKKMLEGRKVCSTVFLDVAQAFHKVWHEGLNYKLTKLLPKQFSQLLFRIKQEDTYSELKEITAGIPQGNVIGPVLLLIYTSNIPELETGHYSHRR